MDVSMDGDALRVSGVASEDALRVIELAAAAGLREVMVMPVHQTAVEIVISRPRGNPRNALVPMVALAAALDEEDPVHWLKTWQVDNQRFYDVASRLQ